MANFKSANSSLNETNLFNKVNKNPKHNENLFIKINIDQRLSLYVKCICYMYVICTLALYVKGKEKMHKETQKQMYLRVTKSHAYQLSMKHAAENTRQVFGFLN